MAIIRCKFGSLRRTVYSISTIFGMRTLVCTGHLPTEQNFEILIIMLVTSLVRSSLENRHMNFIFFMLV